jgi:RND family efflux transporter MFP subunit
MAARLAFSYSLTKRHLPTLTQKKKSRPMKLEAPPSLYSAPTRHRWRKPAIGLALAVLAAGGWTVLHGTKTAQASAPAAPKAQVYELAQGDVATVRTGELHVDLPLSGSLAPLSQATVKSKVSGVVLDTAVREGMRVTAGQVIARLDAADARVRVAQQQAALDEANARLSLAQKNNANSAALLRQNYISQSSYDTTQNGVELSQAAVDAARAQLELARIALSDTVVKAPLSGVVSKRFVQAGEKLAPDVPVFSIVNLDELTLEAQVPASDIPRVKVGQQARFTVDGFDGRSFSGKVARINPVAEAGSRAMLVYISVDNADNMLRGGMFAKGSITTAKSAPHPLAPLAALRKGGGRDIVYRIEGSQVVAQPVQLGLRDEDEGMVEVTEGLVPGWTVIAAKLDGVQPGSMVKLAADAAPAAKKG